MKPEECDILIFKHMLNGDLDAVLALFEETARFVTGTGDVVEGHEAIRPHVEACLNAEKLEWTYGPKAYLDSTGSLALLRGSWEATFLTSDGNLEVQTGKNVEVVRKQADGSWRFVIDHAAGAD